MIGRITTGGAVSSYSGIQINFPQQITTGSDGALWFTNFGFGNGSIGRITTSGAVTNYTDPSIGCPGGITAGPDGALWFTNGCDPYSIGRITTSGVVSIYTDPSIDDYGGQITSGPDGNLWFTNPGTNSIGSITTTGTVTNYTDPSIDDPGAIATGPDGALWFTNEGPESIGRITAVPSLSISPTSGPAGTPVDVSGTGYTPGEQVNVTYKTGLSSPKSLNICSITANTDGTLSCTGNIPASDAGADGTHTIKAKGVTSLATATTTFALT